MRAVTKQNFGCKLVNIFFTNVLVAQIEMVLLSTHNICFCWK